jgi:hypothetical protein
MTNPNYSNKNRPDATVIMAVIWIILCVFGYIVLIKAVVSGKDGGAGCLGELFGVPYRLNDARSLLLKINIILIICIIVGSIYYFNANG